MYKSNTHDAVHSNYIERIFSLKIQNAATSCRFVVVVAILKHLQIDFFFATTHNKHELP